MKSFSGHPVWSSNGYRNSYCRTPFMSEYWQAGVSLLAKEILLIWRTLSLFQNYFSYLTSFGSDSVIEKVLKTGITFMTALQMLMTLSHLIAAHYSSNGKVLLSLYHRDQAPITSLSFSMSQKWILLAEYDRTEEKDSGKLLSGSGYCDFMNATLRVD